MPALRASVAILLAPMLSGCLGASGDDVVDPTKDASSILGPLLHASATPLWSNPNTYPHPSYGFATLTNPGDASELPRWWRPVPARALPERITGLSVAGTTDGTVPTGAGTSVFGSLAVVPGDHGTHFVDISDPTRPRVLGVFPGATRGSDIIAFPDGRLVTVLATEIDILHVVDFTDPTDPVEIATIEPPTRTHKADVVPGTPILYNANSMGGNIGPQRRVPTGNVGLGAGVTEIYDLSDPANPVLVRDFANGYGCHRIFFYIDASSDYYRAICAGHQVTQLWDIRDPLRPEVVVSIRTFEANPLVPSISYSNMRFSHFALLSDDHSVLVVGDETGGGIYPPGCSVHAEPGGRSVSGPIGNLYFYDIRDEADPVLVGRFSASFPLLANPPDPADEGEAAQRYSCTAHHGRLVPDPTGRDLLAMAFYRAGVILVDFTDPANPTLVDQWNDGTQTWEAWYYNGYVFTGDIRRGLDVLTFR
ncbi:MAG: LVIVD repeat-containing protein [Methanobacteriota archaeon]